ncbi:hypothetical protein CASFOL_031959 [Castilleja foliolosa]
MSVKVTRLLGARYGISFNQETTVTLLPSPVFDLPTREVEVGEGSRGGPRQRAGKHTINEVFEKLDEHSDELKKLREDMANVRNKIASVHDLVLKNNELLNKLVEQRSISGPEPQASPPPNS